MHRSPAGLAIAVILLAPGSVDAQTDPGASDSLQAPAETMPRSAPAPKGSRVYTGGAIGLNFWNDTVRFSVEPILGYRVTPQLSVGGRLRYEYFKDKRGVEDFTMHNYGGSVFSRYRLIPQLYGHAEFAYGSYDYPAGREGVPFLFLGGGIVQPLGGSSWAYAEVLVDVLRDDQSPYEDWDPQVTFGVGVGL